MAYQITRSGAIVGADRVNQPTTRAIGVASAASTKLAVGTWELVANTACYFRQGTSAVTATANDHYLPAGSRELIRVTDGDVDGYVAVIRAAVDGTLFISRLTRTL